MKYPNTIQLPQLKIRNIHSISRLLSPFRFDLTESQINNMKNYNFTEFDKNSIVVKKYSYLKKKIWDGFRYYKNEHLNMILVVSRDGYWTTTLKIDGTDYSDYNNRNGWGDSVYY